MDTKTSISLACKLAGSQKALALVAGVSSVNVGQWVDGSRKVPQERCARIERALEGKVSCEQLNPTISWHRIADPDWPWHPEGKPLIDALPAEADQAA